MRVNFSPKDRLKQIWSRKQDVGSVLGDPPQTGEKRENNGKSEYQKIEVHTDEANLKRLLESIIGQSRDPFEASRLLEILVNEGWKSIWITRIADWKFILGFHDSKEKERAMENEWNCLRKWFIEVASWSLELEMGEQIKELSIQGLPLMLWNSINFEKIASLWGRLIKGGGSAIAAGDARECIIHIKTTHRKKIQEEVELWTGLSSIKIWVVESKAVLDQPIPSEDGAPRVSTIPNSISGANEPFNRFEGILSNGSSEEKLSDGVEVESILAATKDKAKEVTNQPLGEFQDTNGEQISRWLF